VLQELEDRKAAHVHKFAPYYIASVGAHLFNIYNKDIENGGLTVVPGGGDLPDFRMHILLLSPRGIGKTYWQKQFILNKQTGLIRETSINCSIAQVVSESGITGTVGFNQERGAVKSRGLAETRKYDIIAIDEFSTISAAAQQSHSKMLDPVLLQVMDTGQIAKNLGPGEFNYVSYFTMWTGTQPTRFDLSQGLDRRFFFLFSIPTAEQIRATTEAFRAAMTVPVNPVRTTAIRALFTQLASDIKTIKKVRFSPDINRWFDEAFHKRTVAWEEMHMLRLLMGLTLTRKRVEEEVVVEIDDEGKRLILQEMNWRRLIAKGPELAMVEAIVESEGGKMELTVLKDWLAIFGINYVTSSDIINTAIRTRSLRMLPGEFVEVTHPTNIWKWDYGKEDSHDVHR